MKKTNYSMLAAVGFVLVMGPNVFAQSDLEGSVAISPAYGIQVSLIDKTGVIVDETTTDVDGSYYFIFVLEDYYKLKFSGDFIKTSFSEKFWVSEDGATRSPERLTYNTPGLITAFYICASMSPDEFPQMVREKRNSHALQGQTLRQIDHIANQVTQEAHNLPSLQERREKMDDIAVRAGVPLDIARNVENEPQFNPKFFGFTLGEMLKSIRQILAGNASYYYRTQLYMFAKQSQVSQQQFLILLKWYGIDLSQYMEIIRPIAFYYTLSFIKMYF